MPKTIFIVWLILIAATLMAFALGEGVARGFAPEFSFIPIMAIAALKARLVMRHFMEVASANLALKLLTDIWLAGLTLSLSAILIMA